jgi:hypothetical protein
MAIKKIYSDYQSENLRDLPWLQNEFDELNTEEYYIAQRDEYNKQQEEDWYNIKENFKMYSEKYYEIMRAYPFKPQVAQNLIFDQYLAYKINKLVEYESFRIETNPIKRNALLNPKNIKIPEEPIPITDLQPFKDAAQEKIREIEQKIKELKTETSNAMSQSSYEPLYLDHNRWLYQNAVYEITGGHSDEEKKFLILEFADKDRRKFERLKNKFSGKKSDEVKYERTRISEEVRIAVWRRDQGRCARCGNRENLEYDHIVPVTKGGGNTERNVELLCQDCNRAKGNRIE